MKNRFVANMREGERDAHMLNALAHAPIHYWYSYIILFIYKYLSVPEKPMHVAPTCFLGAFSAPKLFLEENNLLWDPTERRALCMLLNPPCYISALVTIYKKICVMYVYDFRSASSLLTADNRTQFCTI